MKPWSSTELHLRNSESALTRTLLLLPTSPSYRDTPVAVSVICRSQSAERTNGQRQNTESKARWIRFPFHYKIFIYSKHSRVFAMMYVGKYQ